MKHSTVFLFAVCTVAVVAGPFQWWFTAVGARDARALIEAEKQAAIALCERDRGPGAQPYMNLTTGALLCAGPSNRLAPLMAHPLKGQ